MILTMKIKPKNYAHTLVNLVTKKSKAEIEKIINDFVKYLRDHQALHLSQQILAEFSKIYNHKHNVVTVNVSSAKDLSSKERADITQVMEKRLQAKIELHNIVNPNLVAGLQLSWDDNIWDDTVAGKLKIFKKNLN